MSLSNFLEQSPSEFETKLVRNEYAIVANSGRRGGTKYFCLGYDDIRQLFVDIADNFETFSRHKSYIEGEWRDLNNDYFTSGVAKTLCAVQTRTVFALISKILHFVAEDEYADANALPLTDASILGALNLFKEKEDPDATHDEVDFGSTPDTSGGENVIIYGAPGTGKSWEAEGDDDFTIQTVFHSDTTYQDFVGSYRPCKVGDSFSYEYIPGPFTKAVVMAQTNPHKECFLIIDEINRANAGAVFGEVFQLLDRDDSGESCYSITPENSLADYLRLHTELMGDNLWIPANLTLRATMNSADQGVYPLDAAFKRRWKFEYMPIDFMKATHSHETIKYGGEELNWEYFATEINNHLAIHHINEDRHLGHYFLTPKELEDTGAVASKILIYLWDDVVRHQRGILFKKEYRTFATLMAGFKNDEKVFLDEIFE